MTINIISTLKKHLFLIFFLTPILIGCSPQNALAKSAPTKGFVQVLKTVNVEECVENTPCKIGSFGSIGSGGVIEHHNGFTLILTAAHVCKSNFSKETDNIIKKKSTTLIVRNWKNNYYPARVLKSSSNRSKDLCTIYIASPKEIMTKIRTTKKRLFLGQEVITMASPLGIYHPPTVPILSGRYSGMFTDKINSMVTIPSQPGSSGALVLNLDYEIVGVIYAVSPYMNHITLAVGKEATDKFVKDSIKIFKSESKLLPIPIQVLGDQDQIQHKP